VDRAAFAKILATRFSLAIQTVTPMNSVSSRRSPSRPGHVLVVASRNSVTAVPLGVRRSSGSNVSRPIKNTLFKSAIV
jgi:hypothetical protein